MIIGFTGRAGAGKTTAAEYIAGFKHYSFAAPIKALLNPFFGWDDRHAFGELKEKIDERWGFSPRAAYQTFGTEFARALNPDFWIRYAESAIPPGVDTVIDDIRFPNEAAWVRERGILIHIERASLPDIRPHASELPLPFSTDAGDMEAINNGSIDDLHRTLDVLMLLAGGKGRGGD